MTKGEQALIVASIGATATVFVAVIGAVATYFSTKRDRRRLLYSDAVKAAVAWKEQLYRVRRRQKGDEAELVQRFHEIQDALAYHQAWVGSESKYMKRSYDKLVRGVKRKTDNLITAAWADAIRPHPGIAAEADEHPELDDLVDDFLRDVRSHLSPFFPRKLWVTCRNGKPKAPK